MAKKKKSTYTKPSVKKAEAKKTETKKSNVLKEAKEPSKSEILFFRIGMLIITLVVVGVLAVFLINYFTEDEDENPYEDYVSISQTTLDEIVRDNGDNTFGDRSAFQGVDDYEDLLKLLNTNEVIYFYFYYSSDIDEDILEAIEGKTSVGEIPTYTDLEDNEDSQFAAFFFIDLDSVLNTEIFSDTTISHLELDEDEDNMLVVFDTENPDNEFFSIETEVDEIVDIINGI